MDTSSQEPQSNDSGREQRLDDLLDLWEAERQQGKQLSVEELTENDPELRQELGERIEALQQMDRFIIPPQTMPLPPVIGPYRVVREVAHGGLSAVYLCRQEHPPRDVALKLLQAPRLLSRHHRRFQLEIELLATLQHPAIAEIYDAGTAEIGGVTLPYFTMEWISGQHLDDYMRTLRACGESIPDGLHLFQKICDAVQYAHDRGVVHRDLKPANVLVDSHGHIKIIDFGIARIHAQTEGTDRQHTATHELLGTPAYMSPEQFELDAGPADARSDQYSLGVILYAMLLGNLPHGVQGKSFVEIGESVRNEPIMVPMHHDRKLARDLGVILEKAMARFPEDRYPSVHAMSADIGRFLEGRPIEARNIGRFGQLQRLGRRYPKPAAVVVTALTLMAVCLLLASGLALVTHRQATRLTQNAARLQHEKNQSQERAELLRRRGEQLTEAQSGLQRAVKVLQRSVMNARLARAHDVAAEDPEKAHALLLDAEIFPPRHRGFSWQLAYDRSKRRLAHFQALNGPVLDVALSAGGTHVATLGIGRICVWNVGRGERCLDLLERIGSHSSASIDAAGRRLLVLKDNGHVILLDVNTQDKALLHNAQEGYATAIAISPSGRVAAVGDTAGVLRLWHEDWSEAKHAESLFDQPITSLTFNEGATQLGIIAADGTAQTLDIENGKVRVYDHLPSGKRWTAGWGPQLKTITAQREYGEIQVRDAKTRRTWRRFDGCGPNPMSAVVAGPTPRVVVCRRSAIELYETDGRVAYLETGPTPAQPERCSRRHSYGSRLRRWNGIGSRHRASRWTASVGRTVEHQTTCIFSTRQPSDSLGGRRQDRSDRSAQRQSCHDIRPARCQDDGVRYRSRCDSDCRCWGERESAFVEHGGRTIGCVLATTGRPDQRDCAVA